MGLSSARILGTPAFELCLRLSAPILERSGPCSLQSSATSVLGAARDRLLWYSATPPLAGLQRAAALAVGHFGAQPSCWLPNRCQDTSRSSVLSVMCLAALALDRSSARSAELGHSCAWLLCRLAALALGLFAWFYMHAWLCTCCCVLRGCSLRFCLSFCVHCS